MLAFLGVFRYRSRAHEFTTSLLDMISSLGSSLEYLSIHRNTKTTSPLHRPEEEVVLTAPDGKATHEFEFRCEFDFG